MVVSADHAVDYLQSYEPDGRPLFFMFSTNLPHPPFFDEERYVDLYPPDDLLDGKDGNGSTDPKLKTPT